MRKYYAHFPGDIYAIQFFDISNMKDLKEAARNFLGVKRLPNGTQLWSTKK